jgi:putative radical SAM enzyme (TIGR03279 family)
MPLLRRLAEHGIRMHTQVVVVPEFNDGAHLNRTIDELSGLHPMIESLAIVPVGLTRFRDELPPVRGVSPAYARALVRRLRVRSDAFRSELSCGFVYVADEFFVLAGRPFPRAPYYDDFAQIENGVGLARRLLDHFARWRGRLPQQLDAPLTLWWVTGVSAATFLEPRVIERLRRVGHLTVHPITVANHFFGDRVTVSGLLTGRDIRDAVLARQPREGLVLLPPHCLNSDHLFLDDLTVTDLEQAIGLPVVPTPYEFAPFLRSLLLAPHSVRRRGLKNPRLELGRREAA